VATATMTSVVFFIVLMFFVFNSYFDKICLNDQYCFLPKHIIDQQFYSRRLLAALAGAAAKMRASVIAWTGEGGNF
jgi:hypothetical protein